MKNHDAFMCGIWFGIIICLGALWVYSERLAYLRRNAPEPPQFFAPREEEMTWTI